MAIITATGCSPTARALIARRDASLNHELGLDDDQHPWCDHARPGLTQDEIEADRAGSRTRSHGEI